MSKFTDYFPASQAAVGGGGGVAINEQTTIVQNGNTPGFDSSTGIYTHPNGQQYLRAGSSLQASQTEYPNASPTVVGLGASTTYQDGIQNTDWLAHDGTNGWSILDSAQLQKYSADWSTLISTLDLRTLGIDNIGNYTSVASDGTSLYVIKQGNTTTTRRILKISMAGALLQNQPSNGAGGVPTGIMWDFTNSLLLVTDENRGVILRFNPVNVSNLGTYFSFGGLASRKGFSYRIASNQYIIGYGTGAQFVLINATTFGADQVINGLDQKNFYINPNDDKLWRENGNAPPNGYFELWNIQGTYTIPNGVDPVTSQPYFWRIK